MKKFLLFLSVISLAVFAGCSRVESDSAAESDAVEQAVLDAFAQMYPDATDVSWTADGEDWLATFSLAEETKASCAKRHRAWFSRTGKWKMTEVVKDLDELPEAVQKAYAESDYASWTFYRACSVERNNVVILYLIETLDFDKTDTLMVNNKAELYFSETGYLVKENIININDVLNPSQDTTGTVKPEIELTGMDSTAVVKVNEYVTANYPGGTVTMAYYDKDGATVVVEYESVTYQLHFKKDGSIGRIASPVDVATLPEAVTAKVGKLYQKCDSVQIVSAVKVQRFSAVTYYRLCVSYMASRYTHGKDSGVIRKDNLRITEKGKLL